MSRTLGHQNIFMSNLNYILDINLLEVGDIILTTGKHPVSKSIKVATKSNYSHAMLYVGHCCCIHSTGDRVHSINPQNILFEKKSDATVFRILPNIKKEVVKQACFLARTQIGKEYTVKEAFKTVLPSMKRKDVDRQFCSRLVARSYEKAGIKLVADCNYCTPQELADSVSTYEINNCVKVASKAEIAFSEKDEIVKTHSQLKNKILKEAKLITKEDIQTIEQLTACIVARNELDTEITTLIQESGYIETADYDLKENPWRYDINLFNELDIPHDQKLNIARQELESAKQRHETYNYMYKLHTKLDKDFKLKYNSMWLGLYEKLLRQTNTTLMVFDELLNE